MKQQILTMLHLQNEMNAKVHPNWREQGYQWYRAIWVECAEMMDHHGWKWWKKQEIDREQVVLELIDIWHFGLSDLLQDTLTDFDDIAQRLSIQFREPVQSGNFLEDVETFTQNTLSQKHFPLLDFMPLMQGMDLSFTELYRSYVGKNVLNFFRQDNGYKDGTYHKIWDGKEDNEHLVEIVNTLDANSERFKEDVYGALLARYPQ